MAPVDILTQFLTPIRVSPSGPVNDGAYFCLPDFSPHGAQVAVQRILAAHDHLRGRRFEIVK
jgi:hypothetical protein